MTEEASASAASLKMLANIRSLNKTNSVNRLENVYFKTPSWAVDGAPYPWAAEWHAAGKHKTYRALLSANQCGKSFTGGAEVAMHLQGIYPSWWEGRVWNRAIQCVAAAPTNELMRESIQKALFGDVVGNEPKFDGMIKRENVVHYGMRSGTNGAMDFAVIKHSSGGESRLNMKAYEQGPSKFQAITVDLIWLDEEPENKDIGIWGECVMRIGVKKGMIMLTRTPLFGMTDIVKFFLEPENPEDVYTRQITWADAPHITPEVQKALLQGIPEHERETRSKGDPLMGEGAIFTLRDEELMCDCFDIPDHFAQICGVDFGWGHPFGFVHLAHDRLKDVIYVVDSWKVNREKPSDHCIRIHNTMKDKDWVPIAWPHDGLQSSKSGETTISLYRDHHVNMMANSARFEDAVGGRQDAEIQVATMQERMAFDRIKVFRGNSKWFEEKRRYHRKDGKIVAVDDDILKATFYAMMMIRHAESKSDMIMRKRMLTNQVTEYNPLSNFLRSE